MLIIVLLNGLLITTPATAGQASNALGVCMADSLTGKERKKLAQWIFFGMSSHPEMKPFSSVTEATRNKTDQSIGKLITRLLTEDCPTKAKFAIKKESSMALQSAFELVGRVAMQELMTNKDVTISMSGFEKYMDKDKLSSLATVK